MEDRVEAVEQVGIEPGPGRVESRSWREPSAGRVDPIRAGHARVEGLGRVHEPATGWDLAGGVPTGQDILPEVFRRVRGREDPADANDRDGVAASRVMVGRHRSARGHGGGGDQLVAAESLAQRGVNDALV